MSTETELRDRAHYAEGTANLAMKHRDDAEQQRDALILALTEARSEFVVTIAFLGRDSGTARMQGTVDGLIDRLVKADAAAQKAIDLARAPLLAKET